ncbi:MAG: 50S ribosomal protein L21 [Bacteroidota bacterium]
MLGVQRNLEEQHGFQVQPWMVLIDFLPEISYSCPAISSTSPEQKNPVVLMYAVVEIAGKQFTVDAEAKLTVPKLDVKIGDKVKIEKVLLLSGKDGIKIGTPTVKGAAVEAKVLAHVRGDTITVFKKKRRKGYRVKRGHRQPYTEIEITKIA